MFFRSKNLAPYRRHAKLEMKHYGIIHLHALPNGLLLGIQVFHDDGITSLTLFDTKTTKKIAEHIIDGHLAKIIPLDDDNFLLKKHDNKLQILSSKNLEVIENLEETIDNFDTACLISNNRFVSIHEKINENLQLTLLSHDCKTKQFNQKCGSSVLIKSVNTRSSNLGKIIKLDNDQIAFKVLGNDKNYFMVHVYEKKSDNECEYTLSYTIHPKTSRRIYSNSPSGSIVALRKGRLLTYHDSGEYFQIWEGQNCVKEWNWITHNTQCADIQFEIGALPDNEHLLIKTRYKLFLLNIGTLEIKNIEVGKLDVWDFCIYPNGQTVISATNKNYNKNILLAVDFDCVANYRKGVSTLLSQRIGKDPGSIVNGYLGHENLWIRTEATNKHKTGACTIC